MFLLPQIVKEKIDFRNKSLLTCNYYVGYHCWSVPPFRALFSVAKRNDKHWRWNVVGGNFSNSILFQNPFWKFRYVNWFSRYLNVSSFCNDFLFIPHAIFNFYGSHFAPILWPSFCVKWAYNQNFLNFPSKFPLFEHIDYIFFKSRVYRL